VDDESVQIIMDSQRERIQIYTWKKETKEVNLFFELFDSKLREYRAFILCPSCKAKVSSMVKFCPECGEKLK
ncbi:MAG: zinc ribbon domain-containing protein, partial [Phascolarctobacterium sp.]|nr:zinc ribbon domain-containing protein [Phascolarctobacterium sp.]